MLCIPNHGFAELYVGKGGKTPHLNYDLAYEINAKNEGLFRYQDSLKLYKIDEKAESPKYSYVADLMYKSFEELVLYNKHTAWESLKKFDIDGLLSQQDNGLLFYIQFESIMMNELLKDGAITIAQIIELYSTAQNRYYYSRYTSNLQETVSAFKTAIKYSEGDLDYEKINEAIQQNRYNLLGAVNSTPDNFDLFDNIMPSNVVELIYNYYIEPLGNQDGAIGD